MIIYKKNRFKNVDKAIESALVEHYGNCKGAFEVAKDTWNVYYPNSVWSATETIWFYKTKVSNTKSRTFVFKIETKKGVFFAYKAVL